MKHSTPQHRGASQSRACPTASPRRLAKGHPGSCTQQLSASPEGAGQHAPFATFAVFAVGLIVLSGDGTAQPAQDLARVAPVEWGNWTYALDRLEEAQQNLMLVAPTEWEAFDAARTTREETRNALELAAPTMWAAHSAAEERLLAAEERLAFAAPREIEMYERLRADANDAAAFEAVVKAEMAAMKKVAPTEWAAYESALLESVRLEFGALPKAAPTEFKSWSDAKRHHGDARRSLWEIAQVELEEYDSVRAEARATAELLRGLAPAHWAEYKRGLAGAILGRVWP